MQVKRVAFAFFLLAGISTAQTVSQGLSKIELLGYLAGGSSNAYLDLLLKQRGISFTPDDAYWQTLRAAGGQEFLLAKLRDMRPAGASVADSLESAVLGPLARCAELGYKEAFAEAEPLCRVALTADPQNPILNLVGSTLFLHEKKYDEAFILARRAIELAPALAPAHVVLGRVLDSKGDAQGAVSEFHAALKLDPNEIDALVDEGRVLATEKGNPSAAVELNRQALRIQPNSSRAHMALAVSLRMTNDLSGAVAEFQKAGQLDTFGVPPRLYVGMALFDHKDYDAALAAYREGLRIAPGNAALHAEIGWTLLVKGDGDAAIPELREAIRLAPESAMPHRVLGEALLRKGDLETAIQELREAIRLAPNSPPRDSALAYGLLGEALSRKGEQDAAIPELREAIRLDPDNAARHAALAAALGLKGDVKSAQEELRMARERDPANSAAYAEMETKFSAEQAQSQRQITPTQKQDERRSLPEPDRGSVSGRTYKNEFFGFSYELPQGWTTRSPEELRYLDAENTQETIKNYGPNAKKLIDSGILTFANEWTLLYATLPPRESDSGHSARIISLTAEEGNPFQRGDTPFGHGDAIDHYFPYSDVMQTGALATSEQYRSYHLERKPTPQSFGGRKFVRADFRIKKKGGDLWEARIVTFAKGYFLKLEILAGGREELDRLAETAGSFAFSSVQE